MHSETLLVKIKSSKTLKNRRKGSFFLGSIGTVWVQYQNRSNCLKVSALWILFFLSFWFFLFSQHSIKIWQFHHFSFDRALSKASQIIQIPPNNPPNSPLVWAPGSSHTCRYGSNSRVALFCFFIFWSGWVYKQQQPVAAQQHSDPCGYLLAWATPALSDNTKVRRGICEETGFVEQERLTWPRVAVSDAVAAKVPVSVSSSPSHIPKKKNPRDISPEKAHF